MEESMIRSRTAFVFLLVCGLVVLGSVAGQQTDASRPGWISDESCGTQHTKPGRADCVQKCWRGGASVGHPEWNPNGPSLWQTMIKESGLSATLKPLGTCLLHTWCWQANSTVRGRPFTSRRSHLLRTSAVQSTGHILVSSRNRTCSVQCPHGSSTLALVAICKRRRFG